MVDLTVSQMPTPMPSNPAIVPPPADYVLTSGTSPRKRKQSVRQAAATSTAPARAPRAHWSSEDIHELLALLLEEQASSGDGSNFKASTWNRVASELTRRHPQKPKSSSACSSKFTQVIKAYH